MNILYVDSTVRGCSRTSVLGEYLLSKLGGTATRHTLRDMTLPTVDEAFLSQRDKACAAGDFSADIFAPAREFAAADVIAVAAPFWDLSFPAALKAYFEQINVLGLTFEYTPEGVPAGLCRAKKLFYVTTAGGQIFSEEYGFGYVKALAQTFYGISECVLFKAEGLDIFGADTAAIMSAAKKDISGYVKS